jgi:hypothetical protein
LRALRIYKGHNHQGDHGTGLTDNAPKSER